MSELVVAVLGPDRPGIVAAVSEVLLAEEGNLADASMHLLRGQFAMTLVVDLPRGAEQVRAELAPLAARLELVVSVREVPPHAGAAAAPAAPAAPAAAGFVVRVYGADRPGLVHRVTALLAGAGGNLTDLATRASGGLYVLLAEVDLPTPTGPAAVRAELAALAAELGVEISLEPAVADLL